MSPQEVQRMYDTVAQQIPQQSNQAVDRIAANTAAMGPGLAETGGTGGRGIGAYNYNRLITPAVNTLRDQLVLQGRQQSFRQGVRDESQAAQERYTTAQRSLRTRQREAQERARREAEERANREYQARMASYRAAASGAGGGGGGGGSTPVVGGVTQRSTQTSRSPGLTGAQQMFRAENPALYTAARLVQPLVPQNVQNMVRSATNLYPLARLAGTFLGAR